MTAYRTEAGENFGERRSRRGAASGITAREVAVMGLMLSAMLALSAVEGLLPPLPLHMRFGMSNIITMYAVIFIGRRAALTLTLLKSLFALLTRGAFAGLMSFGGGLSSLLAMILLTSLSGSASYFLLSVTGALVHNMAQLALASLIVSSNLVVVYLPLLVVTGIPAGAFTALLLSAVMPVLSGVSRAGSPDGRR